MSDIVLKECSEYYPTNPIFIFHHNVRHCIRRSYMYVSNSWKNVRKSNPIFFCHDNVKHLVDESHQNGNIESQFKDQYSTKASGTHCDVKGTVEGVYYRVRCSFLT